MATWTKRGNLQGPQGPIGPQGDTGTQGPAGPQGPAGTAAPGGLTQVTADARYVKKAGDRMTGRLGLPAGATFQPDDAIPKHYVDDGFVHKAGDTMTGHLTVPTPTDVQHAATKGYVDSKASGGTSGMKGGVHVGNLTAAGLVTIDTGLAVKWAVAMPLDPSGAGVTMNVHAIAGNTVTFRVLDKNANPLGAATVATVYWVAGV